MRLLASLLVLMFCLENLAAEKFPGNFPDLKANNAVEQQKMFVLPEGFEIELVTSEEQGAGKVISLNFDDSGRLWTQTATMYPQDGEKAVWSKPGRDKILVFETPTATGVQTPKVFADELVMPVSVLPWKGTGCIVAQGPELLRFFDDDGDLKADRRQVLMSGFGIQDTHTGIHQLDRAPGDWITMSQGVVCHGQVTQSDGRTFPFKGSYVVRFRENGTGMEILARGLNNIWSWGINREGRVFVHEANDFGYSFVPFERDTSYPSFVTAHVWPESPLHPPTAQGLNLGGTGFCGIAHSEDLSRGFPAAWQDISFVANPITGRVNSVSRSLDQHGNFKFSKLEDFISCKDQMFRPVYVTFGPDGCLYIADWYNRIITHHIHIQNMAKADHSRGRIWRVRHKSQAAFTVPNVATAEPTQLMRHLKSGNTWETRAAWHRIVDGKYQNLADDLKKLLLSPGDAGVKVHAIWCLEGLGIYDAAIWKSLLLEKNEHIRFEALRSLSTLQPPIEQVSTLISDSLSKETSYYVLNEITRFYRDTPQSIPSTGVKLLTSLKTTGETLTGNKVNGWKGKYLALDGSYQKTFLNLLVDKALKKDRPRFAPSQWSKVIDEVPEPSKEQISARAKSIADALAFIRKNPEGDLAKGKAHFGARCVHCHSLKDSDLGFAPPLSGGQARSIESLVSDMLDPSGAMEDIFRRYRVVMKDGKVIEGFRSDEDINSITLTFMGGTNKKIPLKEIKTAGYIKGRSVMPEMAAGMKLEEIRDLIYYIRFHEHQKTSSNEHEKTCINEHEKIISNKFELGIRMEAEVLNIAQCSAGVSYRVERPKGAIGSNSDARFLSAGSYLLVEATTADPASIELFFDCDARDEQVITIWLTRTPASPATVSIYVNGEKVKNNISFKGKNNSKFAVDLGAHRPVSGRFSLKFETSASKGKSDFGIDALQIGELRGHKSLPPTTVRFKKMTLLNKYISEGGDIADINADGHADIVAGHLWWAGPTFQKAYSYAPVKYYDRTQPGLKGYSDVFFTFSVQISDDKWPDLLNLGVPGRPGVWVKNPGETPLDPTNTERRCQHITCINSVCHEAPQLLDIIGDKRKELLLFSGNQIVIALPSEKDIWELLRISPKDKRFMVTIGSLGAGDINGDGRTDILEKDGWWEQPANWDHKSIWSYNKYVFSDVAWGGAQMQVSDIDGDGDNDVIDSLDGHGYGLNWFEQERINGAITFKRHVVMGSSPADNPYGVCFSQLHAMQKADIDGDGIEDFVTGKCFKAHNGNDPGTDEPAVIYWFRTMRLAGGKVELVPYLIDADSGIGRMICVGDLNKDGKPDIVTSNKKGVFAFIQE